GDREHASATKRTDESPVQILEQRRVDGRSREGGSSEEQERSGKAKPVHRGLRSRYHDPAGARRFVGSVVLGKLVHHEGWTSRNLEASAPPHFTGPAVEDRRRKADRNLVGPAGP